MEASQKEQSQLKQVILFLQNQAASGEALLKLNAETDASMRSQLNQKIQQMERELTHLRTTQQESNNQRATTDRRARAMPSILQRGAAPEQVLD